MRGIPNKPSNCLVSRRAVYLRVWIRETIIVIVALPESMMKVSLVLIFVGVALLCGKISDQTTHINRICF